MEYSYQGDTDIKETSLHINCKELLAASFVVKAFTKTLQNIHVLIQTDNTITIAYINKMGGGGGGGEVKVAYSITMQDRLRHLWSWCLQQKRITLRAEHIPGCINTIADRD